MSVSTMVQSLETTRRLSVALTVLRVIAGVIFFAHGAQKFFVYGLGNVVGSFTGMGIPFPVVSAPLVTAVELIGGLALAFGLFTRVAGVGLACVMLGAIVMVHLSQGFFNPAGIEFPLILLASAVALVLAGPGPLSLDAARARRKE